MGRRINVVGTSGSGKTTLGRALASKLGCDFVELDSFQHEPNWQIAPLEKFRAQVEAAAEGEAWVMDGNYSKARDLIWPRADTIIWLDYSLLTCLCRVGRRTFRRWWRQEVLWHGNREKLWWHFCTKDSLFLWVLTTHARRRREFRSAFEGPSLAGKTRLRFSRPAEAEEWLRSIGAQSNDDR